MFYFLTIVIVCRQHFGEFCRKNAAIITIGINMKAAVLHQLGGIPTYEDFPDPTPPCENQILITVKAASVKNLDKARAKGTHYTSYTQLPAIVGMDGVGVLENGTRVYAIGLTGMIAEKALISINGYTVLPERIDDAMAAALPNAVLGSAMALLRARIKRGDTVLVNGATGVTGQLAVQVAKHYGASHVIATGRNPDSLQKLSALGATTTISLHQKDETIIQTLQEIHRNTPIDIVMDYTWGHPVEIILAALTGTSKGSVHTFTHPVRIVTAGSMANEYIQLPSGFLRSSAIEIIGSGIGSLSQEDMQKFGAEVLPEMFQLAADGGLKIGVETAGLQEINAVWNREIAPGKRLVIRM